MNRPAKRYPETGGVPAAEPGQWVCTVCGYVYSPRRHGGVSFEALPSDYRCPGCGHPKTVFIPRPVPPAPSRQKGMSDDEVRL
ncbi:MAG: rubredoxin [Planctomycetota bacterium]